MADRKAQNLDGRRRQPEDSTARFRGAPPDMHPAVGEFVAAIDALVDEHLTDDEVEACLERVLRDAQRSTPADAQAPHNRHPQRRQGADGAQAAATTLPRGVPQRAGQTVPQPAERLLTTGEVAALFRVDPKTVTRWASAGRIGSIRTPGGSRRFRETEIRALLASLTTPASPDRADTQVPASGSASGVAG
jgi:excisionase family DNA binding protein